MKWNEVTPFSRWCAIVVLLGLLPALTFYIGMQFERTVVVLNQLAQVAPTDSTTTEQSRPLATLSDTELEAALVSAPSTTTTQPYCQLVSAITPATQTPLYTHSYRTNNAVCTVINDNGPKILEHITFVSKDSPYLEGFATVPDADGVNLVVFGLYDTDQGRELSITDTALLTDTKSITALALVTPPTDGAPQLTLSGTDAQGHEFVRHLEVQRDKGGGITLRYAR